MHTSKSLAAICPCGRHGWKRFCRGCLELDDAVKMLEEYNLSMDFVTADASFHYFMADAGGN